MCKNIGHLTLNCKYTVYNTVFSGDARQIRYLWCMSEFCDTENLQLHVFTHRFSLVIKTQSTVLTHVYNFMTPFLPKVQKQPVKSISKYNKA